jgi:hypothetical protein
MQTPSKPLTTRYPSALPSYLASDSVSKMTTQRRKSDPNVRALKKMAKTVGKVARKTLTSQQKNVSRLKRMAKTVGAPVSKRVAAKIIARPKAKAAIKISATRAKKALSPATLPKKSTAAIIHRAKSSKLSRTGSSPEFRRHFAQGLRSVRHRHGRDAARKVHAIVAKRASNRGAAHKTFSFISASGRHHTRNL